jgi:recombination protein RecA
LRQKIGVMFGNPETTTGGMALRFYATVRLDMRRVESIKDGGEVTGNRTKVTVKKNKVAPPFKVAEFDIMYNEGISKAGDVLDIAVEMGIVEKRGAFYSYGDTRLGQGRENAKQFLRDTHDLSVEIESKVRQAAGLPVPGTASAEIKPAPDEQKIPLPPKARRAEVKPEALSTPEEEEELETELLAELVAMDGNGEDA